MQRRDRIRTIALSAAVLYSATAGDAAELNWGRNHKPVFVLLLARQ